MFLYPICQKIIQNFDARSIFFDQQEMKGWGTAVIPQLSKDIRNELPQVKGFSERNLNRMIAFYRAYAGLHVILPQSVAKLPHTQKVPQSVAKLDRNHWDMIATIPWGHHFLLLEKVKNLSTRFWYMQKTIEQGWSRDILALMLKSEVHKREGKAVSNFNKRLPSSAIGYGSAGT